LALVGSRVARLSLIVLAGASCRSAAVSPGPPIVQPGLPGEPGRVVSPIEAADLSRVRFTAADVAFMQGMIAHHAQAVEMTGLVKTRTDRDDLKTLALRIGLSQADEIQMMERWLRDRGQDVPGPHAAHVHDDTVMPGMLTVARMSELAAATGVAFDRLFFEDMIRHHDGALIMVQQLLATPGAAQESDMFTFVSEIDSGQRMEMERMGAMLRALQ
jgi:uncharacterized protein (DUF305 family)